MVIGELRAAENYFRSARAVVVALRERAEHCRVNGVKENSGPTVRELCVRSVTATVQSDDDWQQSVVSLFSVACTPVCCYIHSFCYQMRLSQ
jgi:hypothetical protein